jgi:hypothetical protein
MLRTFLNVSGNFVLVAAWALAVLRDKGPYPVIACRASRALPNPPSTASCGRFSIPTLRHSAPRQGRIATYSSRRPMDTS